MAKVALISQDVILTDLISKFLEDENHRVKTFSAYDRNIAVKKPGGYDVIVIDDHQLGSVGEYFPVSSPKLIILVSSGICSSTVMKRINEGVWDFIRKPITLGGNFISSTIEAVKKRMLSSVKAAALALTREHDLSKIDRSKIIGESQAIKSCLASLIPAIESDQSILLTGETGVGKELFAKAAHENSSRSAGRYIAFNCSSIPDTIAEGILFGWKRGAHSQAVKNKPGLVSAANKGTLFLDEIVELSPKNQATLLRCIQEKEVMPLGANRPEKTDFRLVAATNCDLLEMVEKNKFRRDLYYRISASTIMIPPLRDRREDIKLIAAHYIERICIEKMISSISFTDEFIDALGIYDWPGNVRQLINELHGALSRSGNDSVLDVHSLSTDIRASWIWHGISQRFDLPHGVWEDIAAESLGSYEGDEFIPVADGGSVSRDIVMGKGPTIHLRFTPGQTPTLDECKNKLEKEYMRQLSQMVKSNRISAQDAYKLAGCSKATYHRKIKELDLD